MQFRPYEDVVEQARADVRVEMRDEQGAVISMLVSWCEGESDFSAEEMAGKCDRAVAGLFAAAAPLRS